MFYYVVYDKLNHKYLYLETIKFIQFVRIVLFGLDSISQTHTKVFFLICENLMHLSGPSTHRVLGKCLWVLCVVENMDILITMVTQSHKSLSVFRIM